MPPPVVPSHRRPSAPTAMLRILRALRGSATCPGNSAKREKPPLARSARLTPPNIVPAHSVPVRSTQIDMTRLSDNVWRSRGWLV